MRDLFLRQPSHPEYFRTRDFVPPDYPRFTSSKTVADILVIKIIGYKLFMQSDASHINQSVHLTSNKTSFASGTMPNIPYFSR